MKLGMVGCQERRKTLMAISFVEGIRLMSTKLGAPDPELGFGEVASIWWQALQTVSARWRPTEGSTDCALADVRKPIEPRRAIAIILVIVQLRSVTAGHLGILLV